MTGRAYLSIGDVLTLLRQEFPDVTISKIRFLESQGLVNPERTPSGYRKFYEPDVERLRWVLRQQREHFLPLKVIKGRLKEVEEGTGNGHSHERVTRPPAGRPGPAPAPAGVSVKGGRIGGAEEMLPGMGGGEVRPRGGGVGSHRTATAVPPEGGATSPRSEQGAARPEALRSAPPVRTPKPRAAAERAVPAPAPPVLDSGDMTIEELASSSGCTPAVLGALDSFGMLASRVVGGVRYYDAGSLAVARLAASFAAFGVEPRHLRLHKNAAEREAGFVEQVVLPLLRQRNPESRQKAHDTATELTRLGQELRAVLLARALRDQLGG